MRYLPKRISEIIGLSVLLLVILLQAPFISCSIAVNADEALFPGVPIDGDNDDSVNGPPGSGEEGLSGSHMFSSQDPDWLLDAGGRAGVLNDEAAYGLFAGMGYIWPEMVGVYSRLDAEFSVDPHQREHTQIYANLGWAVIDDLWMKFTFDYLNKRVEVDHWDRDDYLDQFGFGMDLRYQISPFFDVAGQYAHYRTHGELFGIVGTQPGSGAVPVYGGVRGGDYDEAGVRLGYAHPSIGFEGELGFSQVWRTYEEMLEHPEDSETNAAVRSRVKFSDLFRTGLDLSAYYDQEFDSDERRSWRVELSRQFPTFGIHCYYEELANDLIDSDERFMMTLDVSLDALFATKSSSHPAKTSLSPDAIPAMPSDGQTDQDDFVQWVRAPVAGMGEPTLKVAQTVTEAQNYFRIGFDTVVQAAWTSPLPLTGSTATLHKDPGTPVEYRRYSINFDGDLSRLPDTIPVTITWSDEFCAATFEWGSSNDDNGSETVMVPRTGGTIGMGGTIIDTVWRGRPEVDAGCSATLGTVTFSSEYVNTMTVTVMRP